MSKVLLTEGDIDLFRWFWMLQVLTLDQIRRLRYFQPDSGALSHPDNVRKRMSRMAKAGFIVGDDIWEEQSRKRLRVYRLGQRALDPLRYHFGIDQSRVFQPRAHNTFRQVYHSLLVSECGVRVVESLRVSDFELPGLAPLDVPFYHTHAVGNPRARRHVARFVSQEDVEGHQRSFRVRPDLVFAIGKKLGYRGFLLEADRATESTQVIQEKVEGYHWYLQTPDPCDCGRKLWQRYGADVRDFRVLVVTTSERRVSSLWERITGIPGHDLVAITTEDRVAHSDMVFDPIWTVAGGRQVSLMRRSGSEPG